MVPIPESQRPDGPVDEAGEVLRSDPEQQLVVDAFLIAKIVLLHVNVILIMNKS